MSNKILIIIVLILAIIVLGTYLFISPSKQQTPTTQQPPIPIEQISSPTPSSDISTISGQLKAFQVEKITPVQNLSTDYSPITPIEIKFTDNVSLDNLVITTQPQTPTTIYMKDTSAIRLVPKSSWEIGTTTITILKQTSSSNGVSLPENYLYRIKTAWPKNPPPEDVSY